MASIDDIWDEPLAPPSPKQMDKGGDDDGNGVENNASHHSVNRSRSTLFLDSDSENETGSAAKPPAEIDDLFEDLDDTPIEELQITPSLDLDALRRAANAEQARNPRTPYEILPNNSPHKEGGLGIDKNEDKDKEKGETKKRKTIPRLDEGRLLGPNGIPALMKEAKKFKIKGKGHEVTDLNRLLTVYQYWTHQLYPRNQFNDTIGRVEKLCHSRRMHVALSVWHDESKGLIHGKEPQEIIDIDPDSDEDHSNQNADNNTHSVQGGQSDPSTSPPSSTSERTSHTIDDDDSIDIDAIIRDDQQNRQQARASSSAAPQSMSKASVNLDEEFDVAMWEDLAFADDPLPPPASRPPPSKPSAIVDQDEDMWDVVRELEAETAVSTAGEKVADVSSNPVSQQITTHSDFDDWDDMYA